MRTSCSRPWCMDPKAFLKSMYSTCSGDPDKLASSIAEVSLISCLSVFLERRKPSCPSWRTRFFSAWLISSSAKTDTQSLWIVSASAIGLQLGSWAGSPPLCSSHVRLSFHEVGVWPLRYMSVMSLIMAWWNSCGMCLRISLGTFEGPALLLLGREYNFW